MCIPPEVDIERHSGIGEAEGGGIDEGQGAKNISSEVDAEDLVCMYVVGSSCCQ